MSDVRYDLVVLNHTSEKSVEALVHDLLVMLDKVGDPYLEYKLSEALLFDESKTTVLDEISQADGERLQAEFRKMGVETELRPTLQLINKTAEISDENKPRYTCPACGHKQAKQTDENKMNVCAECGVIGEKYAKKQAQTEALQNEKRKLEKSQQQQLQEAKERARHEEAEALRQEAREKLGIKSENNRIMSILVGTIAIITMAIAAYSITKTLRHGSAEPPEATTTTETGQTDAQRQSLLTVQGGNGSIILNNPAQKGSSGPDGDSRIAAAEAGSAQQQSAPTNTVQGAALTSDIPGARQQSTQQPATRGENTDTDLLPQLPDPATARVNQQNGILQNLDASAHEIQQLIQILENNPQQTVSPAQNMPTQQWQELQGKLKRLLELGRSDLALVFAEETENPDIASLLVLQVARHESGKGSNQYHDHLLLAMKSINMRSENALQDVLIRVRQSQLYQLTGDSEAATNTLHTTLQQLRAAPLKPAEHIEALLTISHQQPGVDAETARSIRTNLLEQVRQLSTQDQLVAAKVYTHLAAIAFQQDQHGSANDWLKQIPAGNVRQQLENHLQRMRQTKMKHLKKAQSG